MKITLSYADLSVTVESKGLDPAVDAIILSGAVLERIQQLKPKWGKPKLSVEAGLFCPKCYYEVWGYELLKRNFVQCPVCLTRILDLDGKKMYSTIVKPKKPVVESGSRSSGKTRDRSKHT